MVQPIRPHFDFTDYVQLEEVSTVKHEFLEGVVWAMAGGSPDHARVRANVSAFLGARLAGKRCGVFSSDLRVRVQATGLGTYPDVTVVCGALVLDPDDPKQHTVVNPRVIVEVLSPSTENYDRGDKLEHYKQVPSLQEIVLVAHDQRRVDVWRREGDDWAPEVFVGASTVELRSLDCSLSLDDVYRNPLE